MATPEKTQRVRTTITPAPALITSSDRDSVTKDQTFQFKSALGPENILLGVRRLMATPSALLAQHESYLQKLRSDAETTTLERCSEAFISAFSTQGGFDLRSCVVDQFVRPSAHTCDRGESIDVYMIHMEPVVFSNLDDEETKEGQLNRKVSRVYRSNELLFRQSGGIYGDFQFYIVERAKAEDMQEEDLLNESNTIRDGLSIQESSQVFKSLELLGQLPLSKAAGASPKTIQHKHTKKPKTRLRYFASLPVAYELELQDRFLPALHRSAREERLKYESSKALSHLEITVYDPLPSKDMTVEDMKDESRFSRRAEYPLSNLKISACAPDELN